MTNPCVVDCREKHWITLCKNRGKQKNSYSLEICIHFRMDKSTYGNIKGYCEYYNSALHMCNKIGEVS